MQRQVAPARSREFRFRGRSLRIAPGALFCWRVARRKAAAAWPGINNRIRAHQHKGPQDDTTVSANGLAGARGLAEVRIADG